jgi:hypothetical protein
MGMDISGDTKMILELQAELKSSNYYLLLQPCEPGKEPVPGKNIAVQILEIEKSANQISRSDCQANTEERPRSKREPFVVPPCEEWNKFTDEFFRALYEYVSPPGSYSVHHRDGQVTENVGIRPYLTKSGEVMVILMKSGRHNHMSCRDIASISEV